jgi:hypothetical protein
LAAGITVAVVIFTKRRRGHEALSDAILDSTIEDTAQWLHADARESAAFEFDGQNPLSDSNQEVWEETVSSDLLEDEDEPAERAEKGSTSPHKVK